MLALTCRAARESEAPPEMLLDFSGSLAGVRGGSDGYGSKFIQDSTALVSPGVTHVGSQSRSVCLRHLVRAS